MTTADGDQYQTPEGWDDPLLKAKSHMAAVEGSEELAKAKGMGQAVRQGQQHSVQLAIAYALVDIAESLRATGWGARQRSERMRRSRISGEATDE
jgi:hypothetical protein